MLPAFVSEPSALVSATELGFVSGSSFQGYVDLSSLGLGVQVFSGTLSCEVVNMSINSTPLTGELSYDGSVLSGSYNGISIVLNAPA